MDKTPEQVAEEAWYGCEGQFDAKMAYVAAAVIAHVRPQIEAEARAVAIEDVIAHQTEKFRALNRGENVGQGLQEEFDKADAELRALAKMPPGFVVVPLEPTQDMLDAAQYVDECADPMNTFKAIWEAMLAARPK